MKSILLIFFITIISCTQKDVKSGEIIFEKIGNSDKPFTTLVISTHAQSEGTFRKIIVVDEESFNSIYKFVDFQEEHYRGKWRSDEWSAFRVSTVADDLMGSYIVPSREKSIKYFNEMKQHLKELKGQKGISEIQKELDILLKRIGG